MSRELERAARDLIVGKRDGRGVISVDGCARGEGRTSVAIALADAKTEGRIKSGSRVLLTTFGGGFTWGASLLTFV